MQRNERNVCAYQLLIDGSPDAFSEMINQHLEDGYQFMNNDGVKVIEWHGTTTFQAEMVKYRPDFETIDPRVFEQRPEAHEAIRETTREAIRETTQNTNENTTGFDNTVQVERHPDAVPVPPPPIPAWTVDSRDPFEDDDDFDDDEVNDHQLNRMGMINNHNDEEDTEPVPVGERNIIEDVREQVMEERGMGNGQVSLDRFTVITNAVEEMRERERERETTQEDPPF